jgi:hypothetical protein
LAQPRERENKREISSDSIEEKTAGNTTGATTAMGSEERERVKTREKSTLGASLWCMLGLFFSFPDPFCWPVR